MKTKLLIICFFIVVFSHAQEKIQIGINGMSSLVRVINLKEKGVIQLEKANNGLLKIKKLDQSLNIVWDISTDLTDRTDFVEEFLDDKFLYLLLDTRDSDDLIVLKISTSFAATQKTIIKTVKFFEANKFIASEEVICVAGTVKDKPLLIVQENNNNIMPKFISTELKGQSLLQSLNIIDNKIVASFLNKAKKKTEIIYREYNFNGKQNNNLLISPDDDYDFKSAKFFQTKDKKLLVGNYGLNSSNRDDNGSQGIFILNVNDPKKIKYYSFDQFKNFFNFLNQKQQDRLSKQVKKRRNKGREYRFNYRLAINELIHSEDNLLISAEVVEPEFRNNTNNSQFLYNPFSIQPGIWGRQYLGPYNTFNNPFLWGYRQRSSQAFDGYKYIEGLVIAINSAGELTWDNSVPYKNLKYYDLKPHLKLSTNGKNSIVSYAVDKKLQVDEFQANGEIIKNKEISKDETEKAAKKRKAEFENFEHWYENYFINWGVVKNTEQANNSKLVCFIQKIQF
jgi:hypothetical protein